MKKSTQIVTERTAADRRIIETAECLIELYKAEFGENWRSAYEMTVNVDLGC
jgi:hypothetical protein